MTGDLLRLTGLWLRTSKAGKQYLAGRLGNARVVILENRERITDADPTHFLLVGERTNNSTKDTSTDQFEGGIHGAR